MTNYDKLYSEITKENMRMLLAELETPLRCFFCCLDPSKCKNTYRETCAKNINTWLDIEVK